jgi:hypothetical protein
MADYKIGQILTSTEEVEIEKALSGEKVKISKGNKVIIGADKLAHHIRNSFIQPLAEGSIVEGYDTAGIAEYLYIVLRNHLPIDEMMEGYEITKQEVIDEIECALDEIL